MATDKTRLSLNLIGSIVLALGLGFLSSRFYTSASFERPFHFSALVLLIISVVSKSFSRWSKFSHRHKQRHLADEVLPFSSNTDDVLPLSFNTHIFNGLQ
ncbi:hypothetical protein CDD83_10778 [Cordyceps sp. RAO-2017]|nr:hypothetical protein CDD83_10778 [Cordyceps sp. RAO-2017]